MQPARPEPRALPLQHPPSSAHRPCPSPCCLASSPPTLGLLWPAQSRATQPWLAAQACRQPLGEEGGSDRWLWLAPPGASVLVCQTAGVLPQELARKTRIDTHLAHGLVSTTSLSRGFLSPTSRSNQLLLSHAHPLPAAPTHLRRFQAPCPGCGICPS